MDISKINTNLINNSITETRKNVETNDFEKHINDAMNKGDKTELKKVCSQFESVITNIMFKEMKSTIQKSELMPQDSGRDTFQSMLDDKLVEEVAKTGKMGLGTMLYKQLSKQL